MTQVAQSHRGARLHRCEKRKGRRERDEAYGRRKVFVVGEKFKNSDDDIEVKISARNLLEMRNCFSMLLFAALRPEINPSVNEQVLAYPKKL